MRTSSPRTTERQTTAMQRAAQIFGAVFVLVGILGFIPGITTNFDALEMAGPDSEALLLGIFEVSVLHNIVHLGLGVLGLAAARTFDGARFFLIGGGIAYGALAIYGWIIDKDSSADFLPLNTADDWLHAFLAVAMIGAGLALTNSRRDTTATSTTRSRNT